MINVLHIVLGLQVGGLERVVIDLINNSSPEIRSFVVCLEEGGELESHCRAVQIHKLHKPPGLKMFTIMQLYSLVKKLKIDLIHTHNPSPHFYGALAGFLARVPVVHTKHGRDNPDKIRKVILNRMSAFLTRKVIAVSANAADVCINIEKVCPEKVIVIVNGIDTKLYQPTSKLSPTSPEENGSYRSGYWFCTIGIVARLSPEKDHHTLLAACKLLSMRQYNFRLVIIGDGPLRSELERTVLDMELTEQVVFAGMCYDVATHLKQIDIYVLSSTTEGISLTLLESMASGLPIVATNVGGTPEVVVDNVTGFIVPAQKPDLMADKLSQLIDDKRLRESMGAMGRKRIEEQFDIRHTVRRYEELYHDVLKSVH